MDAVRAWLPEGRKIPEDIWRTRHKLITRFALLQAVALGLFGLARGYDPTTCALDVFVIGAPAVLARVQSASRRLRTVSATMSLMCASMVFVDLSGGVTEAHFHFFVMIGIVAAYQDWLAFSLCITVTVLHHAVMGVFAPHSVYGNTAEWSDPVKWALVHGAFVLAASVTHILAWRAIETQVLDRCADRPAEPGRVRRGARPDAARTGGRSERLYHRSRQLQVDQRLGRTQSRRRGPASHGADRISGVLRSDDMPARLGRRRVRGARPHRSPAAAESHRDGASSPRCSEPIVWGTGEFLVLRQHRRRRRHGRCQQDADDLLHHADVAMYLAKAERPQPGRRRTRRHRRTAAATKPSSRAT